MSGVARPEPGTCTGQTPSVLLPYGPTCASTLESWAGTGPQQRLERPPSCRWTKRWTHVWQMSGICMVVRGRRRGRMIRVVRSRIAAPLGIAALVGLCVVGPVSAASSHPSQGNFGSSTVTTETLSGADQYETAIAISQNLWPSGGAPVVYLVSGVASADALAAGAAAGQAGGVILYTGTSGLPVAVADELVRLNPARVEVVGGTSVISDTVLSQVATLLPSPTVVERVAGADAYGTAAAFSADSFLANTGATFHAISPGRVLDSRIALGGSLFHSGSSSRSRSPGSSACPRTRSR